MLLICYGKLCVGVLLICCGKLWLDVADLLRLVELCLAAAGFLDCC